MSGEQVFTSNCGSCHTLSAAGTSGRFPKNLFVAAFIGSPAMNLVEAEIADGAITFGGYRVSLPEMLRGSVPDGRVVLGARPEAFEDAAFADLSLPQIDVDVTVVEELGSDTHVVFPVDAPRVETEELRGATADEDALLAEDRAVFNGRVDPRTAASAGRRLRLVVDPMRFYFFDPATGENLVRDLKSKDTEQRTLEPAASAPEWTAPDLG